MDEADLGACASHNRRAFDEALGPYVATKLAQVVSKLPQGTRMGWLDASGCVWCVFDGEDFVRSGDAGRRLQAEQGDRCGLQVYWSMGDVVMPGPCDTAWVARRIADEALCQLSCHGLRCALEERSVDGEGHLGVCFRRGLMQRWPRRF